jgi:hypothetical protein
LPCVLKSSGLYFLCCVDPAGSRSAEPWPYRIKRLRGGRRLQVAQITSGFHCRALAARHSGDTGKHSQPWVMCGGRVWNPVEVWRRRQHVTLRRPSGEWQRRLCVVVSRERIRGEDFLLHESVAPLFQAQGRRTRDQRAAPTYVWIGENNNNGPERKSLFYHNR